MVLQTQNADHQAVSYRVDVKNTIETAAKSKSPVKLLYFKKKANFRDNAQQDIEINRKSIIYPCPKDEASFQYQGMEHSAAEGKSIQEIQDKGCDKQMVSVTAFVDIDECPTVLVDTKKGKMKIRMHDEWWDWADSTYCVGGHIPSFKTSGVYKLLNCMVREFADNIMVNTITDTIKKTITDTQIKCKEPKVKLYHQLCFPLQDIKISNRIRKCPECGQTITDELLTNKDFFRCANCSTSCRFSTMPMQRTAKVHVMDNLQEITIYSAQLEEYCYNHSVDFGDEGNITQGMLKDEETTMVVNTRNICVAFK